MIDFQTLRTSKVLIFGGQGYIGSALTRKLMESGCCVVHVVDDCWHNEPVLLESGLYAIHDHYANYGLYEYSYWNCQSHKIDAGITLENYDAIIWLSGHSSVAMCADDLVSATQNNVDSFRLFLEKYVNLKKKPLFMYASSASVYGNQPDGSPLANEGNVTFGTDIYDRTMCERERLAIMITQRFDDAKIVGFRFGTVNGGSVTMRTELMMNNMVKTAMEDGKIYVANPTTKRAILWIENLTDCFVSLISNRNKHKNLGNIYNLCSFNKTVGELGLLTRDVLSFYGIHSEIEYFDAPASKYSFYMNSEKSKDLFVHSEQNYAINNMIKGLISFYTQFKKQPVVNLGGQFWNLTQGTRDAKRKFIL